MKRETILATDGASLHYYPVHGIVHHEIHRPLHGEEFRELLLRGAEVLRRHHATKWLSDDRRNAPLSREDGLWTQEIWLPPMLEAGWKIWAMVQPESPGARQANLKYTEWGAPLGLKVALFTDPEAALAWLVAA